VVTGETEVFHYSRGEETPATPSERGELAPTLRAEASFDMTIEVILGAITLTSEAASSSDFSLVCLFLFIF